MKITTKVRYGIRAMAELARRNDEAPIMLGIIAEAQNISDKYLEQLFTLLRNAALVKSERGSKGGYRLAKSAENISLYEIFVALNGPLELVDCLSENTECKRVNVCDTLPVWQEIAESIENILSSKTLAELAAQGQEKYYMYYI